MQHLQQIDMNEIMKKKNLSTYQQNQAAKHSMK